MKKTFLIFLGLLFSGVVIAQKGEQTVGLRIGNSISTDGLTLEKQQYDIALQTIVGGFYDWNFGQRFGLSLGANLSYGQERNYFDCWVGNTVNSPYRNVFELQVPVCLTLNLNTIPTAPFRTYFVVGYTLNSSIDFQPTYLQNGNSDFQLNDLPLLFGEASYLTSGYLTTGLEFRYMLPHNMVLAICPNAQLLTSGYGPEGRVGVNFKLGRIL